MADSHPPRRKFSSERAKGYYQLNDEEPNFTAQYLGMISVNDIFQPEKGYEISARCVDEIYQFANRKSRQKKVSLLISTNISRGITVTEIPSNKAICYELDNVAFCSTDVRNKMIFSFIVECDEDLQCHAFAFKSEETAKKACLALSNAFVSAYDEWSRKQKRESRKSSLEEI
ncbi:low density lipoprotein receptor adapter protein 1-like [Montipora capricornis]|uniref:low density lipoprotein receptor adapter protein 1-like n=1 Tax=Montipora foliosa TaxID=591990 RepID=UPI0035F14DB2